MHSSIPIELQLTAQERQELPERARKYISALERQVEEYKHTMSSQKDELRRKRYSYWNR